MDPVNFKEILTQMQKALECSICLEFMSNPVSTKCEHQFCRFCITKFLQNKRSVPCPLCKVPVTKRGLQERTELSVVINNVQKLITAYANDTENKYSPNFDQQPLILSTSKNVRCNTRTSSKQKVDMVQMESYTQSDSVNTDFSSRGLGRPSLDESDEELNRFPACDLIIPRTKSATRSKVGCSALDTQPDASTEELSHIKQNTGLLPGLRKTEHKSRRSGRQDNLSVEPTNSENYDNSLILDQKEKTEQTAVLYDRHRKMHGDTELRHDSDNRALLHHLEEGSCGAAYDVGNENYRCTYISCDSLEKSVSKKKQTEINKDFSPPQLATKIVPHKNVDIASETLINDNNKLYILRSSRSKLPLSPSNASTSETTQLQILSTKVDNKTCQNNEAKKNVELKNSEYELLFSQGSSVTSRDDGCNKMTTSASEGSSISSVQLMAHMPVTARTYSKDMRKSFYTGFVRNWVDTLPQQHGDNRNEMNQQRGLTTKQKINAKKQNHQKSHPSKMHQVEVVTHGQRENKCLNISDTFICHEDLLKRSEGSQAQFDLPMTPVLRRKSIFKCHVQNTGTVSRESDAQTPPSELTKEEDPYEFKVGQTPVKGKVVANKGRLKTKKSKGIIPGLVGKEKIYSMKLRNATVQNIELNMTDKLPLFQNDMYSGPAAYVQGKKSVSTSCAKKNKIVHLSQGLVDINTEFNESTQGASARILSVSAAEKSMIPTSVDITDAVKHQNLCGLVQVETLQLQNLQEQPALNMSVVSTAYEPISESTSKGVQGFQITENSLKSVQIASINNENYIQDHEITGNLQTTMDDLGRPRISENQKNKTLQSLEKDDGTSKKFVTLSRKRKFARRRKKTCTNTDASQTSGKELMKLIHNISQAEDYELMFNTQDVQQRLQEDLQKEQQHKEAFGFDTFGSDSNVIDVHRETDDETEKTSVEFAHDQTLIHEEMNSFSVVRADNSVYEDFSSSCTKNKVEKNLVRKMPHKVEKNVSFAKETSFTEDINSSNTKKDSDVSVNDCQVENMEINSSVTTATEIVSFLCSHELQPKQNISSLNEKLCTRSVKRGMIQNFSRPNINEMILVTAVAKGILINANPAVSSNGGVELELSADTAHKISSAVKTVPEESHCRQLRDDSNQIICSNIQASLASSGALDVIRKEHKVDEQSSLEMHVTCEQDVTVNPPTPDHIVETQETLYHNPVNAATFRNSTSVNSQESTQKVCPSALLSLKSGVSKLYFASQNQKSAEYANASLDHDIILAPDTCVQTYSCEAVNGDHQESYDKEADPIVLETFDLNASFEFDEMADQIDINSRQNKAQTEAAVSNRASIETIAETQCLSTQFTEGPTAESVSENINDACSTDLNVDSNRTEITCPGPCTNISFVPLNSKNNLQQSLAVAETSQETVSVCSALSQSILLPPGRKRLVSGMHKENLNHSYGKLSKYPARSSSECQFADDDNTKPLSLAVHATPHTKVSPKNQVSSAPCRLHFSGSEDEDHVLIVRRKKWKCFSLNGSPLKPVLFVGDQRNMGKNLSCLVDQTKEKQSVINVDDQLYIEDGQCSVANDREHCIEMIGETEAMKVIDTWTEEENYAGNWSSSDSICKVLEEKQEQGIVTGARPDELHVRVTEQACPGSSLTRIASPDVPEALVEVTPIGKLKYADSSGKFVVDVNDVSPSLSSKPRSQKRLFPATPKIQLIRSGVKDKFENNLHDQKKEMPVKLDNNLSKDTNRNSLLAVELSVPETNRSSDSIEDETCVNGEQVGDSCLKTCVNGEQVGDSCPETCVNSEQGGVNCPETWESRIEAETSATDISCGLVKVRPTKRGLAKKGKLNFNPFVKHPKGILSPASKAAIRRGIDKPAYVSASHSDHQILTTDKNKVEVIDIDCIDDSCDNMNKQNTLRLSSTSALCTSDKTNVDILRCSDKSESELVIVETQNMSGKYKNHNQITRAAMKKPNVKEAQQEYDDSKKQLEAELFGQECTQVGINRNRMGDSQVTPADHTKRSFMKNLEMGAHISGGQDVDDDSDLLFDLGESTDDEAERDNGSVKGKDKLHDTIEIESAEHPDKNMKSSGSLPLTSSPLEMGGNIGHENIDQSIVSAVDEIDINDEDYMWPKTRMKRLQIISDSDDSDQEVTHAQSQTNCTSSSVLSSQSEILTTAQQDALEMDVAKLHQQIAEYEAKLDQQDTDKRLVEVGQVENEDTKAPTADDNDDSNDLFVSPLSPTPPPPCQLKTRPVHRRPAHSESKRHSDQYMKQFQSPGGTVRTKTSLEFTVTTPLPHSDSKHFIRSKSDTEPISLELKSDSSIKDVTNKQPSHKTLGDVHKNSITSSTTETEDDVIDLDLDMENAHNFNSLSPIMLSQKSRRMRSLGDRRDHNSSVTNTSSRNQPEQDMCLIASGLGKEEYLTVMKMVNKHNLTFASKFSREVTHVIMKSASGYERVCDRTLKFFQGLAYKCWIVDFSWVVDSIQVGSVLPEEDYEILGDTSGGEATLGVKRSRICKEHLFAECCFACVGDSSEMPKENLHDLLTTCGAVVADDPISLISKVAKYKFIIRCSDSDDAPSKAELDMFSGLYRHVGLLTVMREWVLDSLGSYKLQPLLDYVINTGANISIPF